MLVEMPVENACRSTDNQHQAREVMCIQQHLLPECNLWCYPLRQLFTVTGIDTDMQEGLSTTSAQYSAYSGTCLTS